MIDFIRTYSKKKITKRTRNYIYKNWEKIYDTIKDSFFEWCFSKVEDKKEDSSPFSGYIAVLSEKLQIDPITLIKTYTPKQLEYLTEWLVWNAQEATDEWKKKNQLRLISKKAEWRSEEENKKINDILASVNP